MQPTCGATHVPAGLRTLIYTLLELMRHCRKNKAVYNTQGSLCLIGLILSVSADSFLINTEMLTLSENHAYCL